MWWTNPYWLPALLIIIPIIRLGNFPLWRHGGAAATVEIYRSGRNHNLTRLTLLRVLTIGATVLALAGTTVKLPSNQRQLVVLFDTSTSIEPSQIEAARSTALRLIGQLKAKDRVAIASFAGEPQLIIPFSTPEDVVSILSGVDLSAPRPGATDLQAALRLGKELLTQASGNPSILLFSDGHPTSGGGINTVLQSMKGIPVNVVPIGRAASGLLVHGLELPENIHPYEPVLGYWKIETDQARTIFLSVKIDDRILIKKRIPLLPGRASVPLNLPGQKTGAYRIMVEATDDQGEPFPGAITGGVFQVKGPARVLVVNEGPFRSPIGESLRVQGMNVEFGRIGDLPETALGLTGYGAVVLDNVPALYLTEAQQTAIQSYVAGGGGLLVVGGDSSLGRGEYYATKLEDLLPVQTDTRQRLLFTRANILFVIDHSGSMSEMVGNTSKQLAAMQGVMGAIEELNPIDEVGILAFDTSPTWILPFTSVSRKEIIRSSLSEIGQGGGTDLATAFEEISNGFRDRGPVRRHTVILTDGLTTSNADFKELITRLRTAGVSVTTIGIGEEINEELLRNIAAWGEGQFYRADLDQIPKVILKETLRVTRDLIQEGSFQPKLRTKAPILSGLDQGLPQVKGYLITKPKNLATVHLEIGKGDPLLASWRYGSGQVAVFTGDSGGRWLAEWSGTSYYNLLWSQLIRAIERGYSDTGLKARTRVEAGNALIEVEAIGTDRRLRTGLQLFGNADNTRETFKLQETALGHYQALVSLQGAGLHTFQIRDRLEGDITIAWAWNQPGEELPIFEPDLLFLGQLASASGGKIFDRFETIPEAGWAWKKASLQNYLIIIALLLLVIELGYRSTSLGQMRMARALLEAWWEAQNRLIDLMRGFSFRDNHSEQRERSVNEAYRYLAERARRNRETADKDG
ncbi:MAG: VWA domain-containing protein [Bacteroidota bacterium]